MRAVLLSVLLAVAAGCGGGSSSPGPGPDPSPLRITITASGVNPSQLTVAQGARVTFMNSDSRAHNMTSDPHPDHGDCPELNTVGLLQPGQSRETGNLNLARTCGFHDHDDPPPGGSRWTGRITIR